MLELVIAGAFELKKSNKSKRVSNANIDSDFEIEEVLDESDLNDANANDEAEVIDEEIVQSYRQDDSDVEIEDDVEYESEFDEESKSNMTKVSESQLNSSHPLQGKLFLDS